MPYFVVEDFRRGIDTRRMAATAAVGSLRSATNVFINAGGEIEKALGWLEVADLSDALMPAQAEVGGLGAYGPITTADGAFAYVGVGPKPDGFPLIVGADVPVRWLPLPADSPPLLDVSSFNTFGDGLYVVGWHDPATNGGSPVAHYFGPANGVGELARVPTPANAHFTVTHESKVWAADFGPVLSFSAIGDPTDFVTGIGAGAINTAENASTIGKMTGIAVYFDQIALFGTGGVQFWKMDPDPNLSRMTQTIGGVDLRAHKSITPYSDGDLIFLDRSGIRSLRARDSSNFAAVDDIGSPIDSLVRAKLSQLPGVVTRSPSVVEPNTGQVWLGIDDEVYVLSRFASADVLAWSTVQMPPAETLFSGDMAVAAGRLLLTANSGRSYLLGGVCRDEYTDCRAEAVTPFMSMNDPGTAKVFSGIDVICEGNWQVDAALDPAEPSVWTHVANVRAPTYKRLRVPFQATAEHVALRFRSQDIRRARIGQVALHFEFGSRG